MDTLYVLAAVDDVVTCVEDPEGGDKKNEEYAYSRT